MKVLVSDSLSNEGLEILKEHFTVDVSTGLSEEELVKKIKDYDALVIRSGTHVTQKIIEAADNLKIIGRAGVGIDNVDVDAATKKGIIVANSPEGNMISAAEHTIAMMMAMSRNIPQANASLKAREWKRSKFTGVEVKGKTLGVIGLGRIGSEVAKRASGLEMNLMGYDPFVSEKRAIELGVKLATVNEIAKEADYITVHTPLIKETRNILDEEQFALMKPTTRVLNCARGGIINEEALAKALESGKIAGAAIDVFIEEPPFDSPLLNFDNVVVTPHLGASTQEAQVNVAVDIAKEVASVLTGGSAKNAINIPSVKPEAMAVLAPYIRLSEIMGKIAGQLVDGNYEKVEIGYNGEISGKDTRPLTVSALKGLLEMALGSGVNYVNAPTLAKSRMIAVVESKSESSEEYSSTISIKLSSNGKTKLVAGTVVGDDPKIVVVDDDRVDIFPAGHMIFAKHINRPNVIGPCCMVLGKNNINISGMQVGRSEIGGVTMMVLNVDSEVSDPILEEVRKVDGILDAKLVTL
ncbi:MULTISPECIES: phosphoglycerate dehydrogenase [Methanosarcina]|uniref:D-3-phosphoglycerate dehydrogenase n=1 Tax=Methanosarcina vacuolata Z-761 TaxID=1434123 RepID=A0A0E3Q0X8_9EURY|nr:MULTISPECIES: phosphoglycerate dehydrogenase [Methanosarcina]AKB42808.1 D-3-phosphoglycerate dehydrogenase [Methanosarcina vacuolata Z-761]AKB46295.1 D-3-phosphoglycerate dehydrogenase [Methanosarcina sp. Kolksee]